MVGWHHPLDGHDFELAPEVADGQGSLACCSPWGCKELDITELNVTKNCLCSLSFHSLFFTPPPQEVLLQPSYCLESAPPTALMPTNQNDRLLPFAIHSTWLPYGLDHSCLFLPFWFTVFPSLMFPLLKLLNTHFSQSILLSNCCIFFLWTPTSTPINLTLNLVQRTPRSILSNLTSLDPSSEFPKVIRTSSLLT